MANSRKASGHKGNSKNSIRNETIFAIVVTFFVSAMLSYFLNVPGLETDNDEKDSNAKE